MSAIGLGVFVVVAIAITGIFVDVGSVTGLAVMAAAYTLAVGAWCMIMWGRKG